MSVEEAAIFTKGKLAQRPQGWSAPSIRRAAGLGLIPDAERFGKRAWRLPEDGLLVWMLDEINHRTGRK